MWCSNISMLFGVWKYIGGKPSTVESGCLWKQENDESKDWGLLFVLIYLVKLVNLKMKTKNKLTITLITEYYTTIY